MNYSKTFPLSPAEHYICVLRIPIMLLIVLYLLCCMLVVDFLYVEIVMSAHGSTYSYLYFIVYWIKRIIIRNNVSACTIRLYTFVLSTNNSSRSLKTKGFRSSTFVFPRDITIDNSNAPKTCCTRETVRLGLPLRCKVGWCCCCGKTHPLINLLLCIRGTINRAQCCGINVATTKVTPTVYSCSWGRNNFRVYRGIFKVKVRVILLWACCSLKKTDTKKLLV